MATITIDRDARALLHDGLRHELSAAGDELHCLLEPIERDKAEGIIESAQWAFEMLTALGWDRNDERDRYELRADAKLGEWLRQLRAELVEWIARDRETLRSLERGEDTHCHVGRTVEGSVTFGREALTRLRADLETIERLLGQVDERIGAVA